MRTFEEYIKSNKCLLVGCDALATNNLVSGYNVNIVATDILSMNGVHIGNIRFEYYHFKDDYEYAEIRLNVWCPTAERAIIDCIVWQEENRDEGFLIEALQTYQSRGHQVSDLYPCADHYLVPHKVVDYWWKEAEEEDDMSMG